MHASVSLFLYNLLLHSGILNALLFSHEITSVDSPNVWKYAKQFCSSFVSVAPFISYTMIFLPFYTMIDQLLCVRMRIDLIPNSLALRVSGYVNKMKWKKNDMCTKNKTSKLKERKKNERKTQWEMNAKRGNVYVAMINSMSRARIKFRRCETVFILLSWN